MKLRHLLFSIGLLTIFACNSDTKTVEPIAEKKVSQAFTDTLALDTFKVALKGSKSSDMKFIFTITNKSGVEIYKEEINADSLLKNYLASEDLKKESAKIAFLNEEVNQFFEEEHFLIPAVNEDEKPDNNVPDVAFYNELKKTKLNGFSYSLGKDKQVYIAWSATAKKVKVYYRCC